jgi:hypothetical protein
MNETTGNLVTQERHGMHSQRDVGNEKLKLSDAGVSRKTFPTGRWERERKFKQFSKLPFHGIKCFNIDGVFIPE